MELTIDRTHRQAPIFLLVTILFAPALVFPNTGDWHGLRPLLIEAIALGSLALTLTQLKWPLQGWRGFVSTLPNVPLLVLVVWGILSFVWMAPAGGRGRAIASAELMRLMAGAAIYFTLAYRCNMRKQLKLTALLLLAG